MTPRQFEEIFDKVKAEAGCLETIRRYVLSVAIQGKLVSQNKLDEPAPELLQRILIVKSKNPSAAGRARRVDTEAFNHLKYEIPDSWKWTTLTEIGHVNPKIEADDHKTASFVEMASIFAEYGHSHLSEAKPWAKIKTGFTRFCEGDVGLAKITPCFENGKSAIFTNLENGIGAGTTELLVVRPYLVEPRYVLAFLKSGFFIGNGIPLMTGTAGQKRVPSAYFSACPFPLPPLEEQKRIVAKVDELMALCDDLEEANEKRITLKNKFSEAAISSLSSKDIFRNNVYSKNLKQIAASQSSIQLLKQKVIDLAVFGDFGLKLDRNTNASELIESFRRAREELKIRTKDRRINLQTEQAENNIYGSLPKGWCVETLQNLFLFIDYRGKTPAKTESGVPLITAKNIKFGYLTRAPQEFVSQETYEAWMTRGLPKEGDLFFTTEAPMGHICVNYLTEDFALAQRTICLQPYSKINSEYFKFAMMSSQFQHLIEASSNGMTARGIKSAKLKLLPLPIPPIEAQDKIVETIENTMSLCDLLAQNIIKEESIKSDLLKTLVA